MHALDLQKYAGFLLMPVGWLWLGLLSLSLVCLRRGRRRLGYALLAGFVFYSLIGNVWVGQRLIRTLEHRIEPNVSAPTEPFDAIFVLGGGTHPDPWGEPQLGECGDRVALAARLWHEGRTRLLIASGSAQGIGDTTCSLGEETRTLWLGMGVPAQAIRVLPSTCWITREEITAIKGFKDQNHWGRIAILSSAWHLPRAMALARRAGLEAVPIGADWRGGEHSLNRLTWIPQPSGFQLVHLACWEYLGRWLGR